MKYECIYNATLNIIEVATKGVAAFGDMVDMLRCVVDICAQKASANILVDHTELDASQLTMHHIQKLSDMAAASKDILKNRKCAQIGTQDLQFGLVRAWEAMSKFNGLDELDTMVFRSKAAAYQWITNNSIHAL